MFSPARDFIACIECGMEGIVQFTGGGVVLGGHCVSFLLLSGSPFRCQWCRSFMGREQRQNFFGQFLYDFSRRTL